MKQSPYIKEFKELDRVVIVRFSGAIDSSTIPLVRDSLKDRIFKYLDKNILADFKDVTHVDSSTLAALIIFLAEHRKHGTVVGLLNIPESFRNYIKIERLESVVSVYSSEKRALKALG